MTERYTGFLVTLKDDIREDDAESVMKALVMVKGVLDVRPVPASYDTASAEIRVRAEVRDQLWEFLRGLS